MISAFAYLMARTTRNRVVTMARRLKQPRYAIGFIIVLLYFGFFIVGSLTGATRSAQRTDVFQSDVARAVVPMALALILLFNWIGTSALGALAFSPAEAAMLFPAPVTRRALILLKIVRAQLPILFNVVIIKALWGGKASAVPSVLGALGLYAIRYWPVLTRARVDGKPG